MPKRRPAHPCSETDAARPVYATSAACPANGTGPFDSADDAAAAALCAANPASIRDNREYGGVIFQGTDGKYYYTGPVQGSDQGVNPFTAAPPPAGGTEVGAYHTHGDYSTADPTTGAAVRTSDSGRDDFNSDQFSTQDKAVLGRHGTGNPGYRGYLGTPSGAFRTYDPASGSDTTF